MERNIFKYIWQHSRREQLKILGIVLLSLPFYFISLDLPRLIVNDAIQGRAFTGGQQTAAVLRLQLGLPPFLGGARWTLFEGIQLPRIEYLFALSGVFFVLVLVNGGFKYVINMRKGALGERLLQYLRADLFAQLLRFTPESLRNVKPSEAATIVKDEVEPIGGFVGDAFVAPAFLGGQALTALTFIIVQNPLLGFLAGAVVGVQGIVIPRLRREQLRLSKMRQLESRALAGRVGEIVDALPAVHSHGTGAFEKSRIAARLDVLYDIRYRLFGRKFAVKFANNLLAQLTPFLFYSIGGYYALKGSLDIGQLVAVIAAYRDLPPPVKELIDWDQQRLDVEVKYEQIVEQFTPKALLPADETLAGPEPSFTSGVIDVQGLQVADARGNILLENVSFTLPLPTSTALLCLSGDGADIAARVLGRQIQEFGGTVRIAGRDIDTIPETVLARHLSYLGPETVTFGATIRDNILYGLNTRAPVLIEDSHGRTLAASSHDWIDYAAAGATGPGDIDERILEVLRVVGLDETIYRFGLGGAIDPDRYPGLAERVVEAREALRETLAAENATALIEPFDPATYNHNATVGENLLFGVPIGETFIDRNLAANVFMRSIIEAERLTRPLVEMGMSIAETMLEIFAGLPGDHFLFEQFSFISHGDLSLYEETLTRLKTRRDGAPSAADLQRIMRLPLGYIEPRHRLGLLTGNLETRIVRARKTFMDLLPPSMQGTVEFYDPAAFCRAAPVRDNLLFGRIAYGSAGAGERVLGLVRRVATEMGLASDIYRIGLDYQAGHGGRLLFPAQRVAVSLARALIKRPDILILNEALAAFGESEAQGLIGRIRTAMTGKSVLATTRDQEFAEGFDQVLAFDGNKVHSLAQSSTAARARETEPAT
jgi:putative ABC transport system ATP-binding protein